MYMVDTTAQWVPLGFLLTLRTNLTLPVTGNSIPVWLKLKDLQEKKKLEKGLYKATGGLRPKSKSDIAYNFINSVPMHLSQL